MGQQTLTEKIRDWIGNMGWLLFLWGNNYTDEQYQKLRDEDTLRHYDSGPILETKVENEQLWVRIDDQLSKEKPNIRLVHF